jgi:hypothetical protein
MVFSIISYYAGLYTASVILFFPGAILFYLLLLVFPDEVTLDEESVLFRTRLRRVFFDYQDIKEIKSHVTTRTLVMSGGDKEKAVLFYQIRLRDKPLRLLMFGSGIQNFRELYSHLLERASKDDVNM